MRLSWCLAAGWFVWASAAGAQLLLPGQMHNSFTFELHSVRDEVLLYEGDPQYLLKFDVQPANTLLPRIDFSNTNQAVVLRLRDLSLFEAGVIDSIQAAEDAELGIDSTKPAPPPMAQVWELQIAPACAGEYVITCDGGKGLFDFTDLPVHEVHLLADTTEVKVEFKRPNPVTLDRFKLTVRAGKVQMTRFLNARPASASLQVDDSNCEVDLTGKPFTGTSDLFIEGVPKRLRLVLPRNAGVHVEGPAGTLAGFGHAGLAVAGTALETKDFASQTCRVQVYFSRLLPRLDVQWGD